MSPIDQISIKDKLFKLQQSIKIIEELMENNRDVLFQDDVLKSAVYFNMIVSIEIILDIGNHILSSEFNKPESSYKDIIIGLGRNGIISEEFSKENQNMGDFRNLLVHNYGKIDDKEALEYAKKCPDVFRKFGNIFIKLADTPKQ